MSTKKEGQALVIAKLESSLLDQDDAKALRIELAKEGELAAIGLPDKLALALPYFDLHGKPTGFKRYRYLEDTRSGFTAQTNKKAIRYVQPPNSISEIYMPPMVEWDEIAKDPGIEIVITEGELKAACCTKLAIPCLGLGGVWSFKSAKKKLPLLPIFYKFEWSGRSVIVAFDSDAHTNPQVVTARNELCKELFALGALPKIANLTPGDDDAKRGLDDLALQEGAESLLAVLESAESFATSVALHELSTEVAYITDPGLIVVLANGQKMRPHDFSNHAYANRHYYEETLTPRGEVRVTKCKAAVAWLEWPMRLALKSMAYEPGLERLTDDGRYNTWPGWGCEPKKGSILPWKQLLDHLFADNVTERQWFERWCAIPIQQPGVKLYTACVLWGVNTGTGKSLVGYTLGRIYGKNFTEIGDGALQDERNEWAIDKQFVMGDDVTGHDQRKYADTLKRMITQQTMRIDQKYVPSYTVRDCVNYLFTSNHSDAFFLEDDDRRNFVHEIINPPMNRDFYRAYMEWLNNGGAAHLMHHLLNLELSGMTAEDRAPNTNARQAMIDDGLSDLGKWVRRLKIEPDFILKMGDVKLEGDLWASADLIKLYDPEGKGKATAGGLSRELKRAGFKQLYKGMQVKTINGQQRLFSIRNIEQWKDAGSKLLADHYDKSRQDIKKHKKF
jgi:hypothetical protein